MSPLEIDDDGQRRSVSMEFEVPGTPEQVWQAIATGPGISSWFVPTDVEERAGGAIAFHIGPGMESSGTVIKWEPPFRFAYEEANWSPSQPPLATECIIVARSGDTCIVRMVHSLFNDTGEWDQAEWDESLKGFESGWPPFFDVLRIYLKNFAGQPCASFRVMGTTSQPEEEVWQSISGQLNLLGANAGEHRQAGKQAPTLSGIIEGAGDRKNPHEVMLRLEQPCTGVALIGAYTWGGKTHPAISFYFYGLSSAATQQREEPKWHAWMNEHLPPEIQAH